MTKAIWLSDLHFTAEGLVQGHNPRERLDAAVSYVNQEHSDAALCVISGDIVDRGEAEDYASVVEKLSRLKCPFYPMVGNHDNRALLRKYLPIPDEGMPNFIQYPIVTDNAVLLCLDTLHEGFDDGEFCSKRLEWLDAKLHEFGKHQVVLFLHHPPMPLGLPMQDIDRLSDGDVFLNLVGKHKNVAHLCIGHVHRPISGSVRGIGFTTMRATLYQAPPPRPKWDWNTFKPAQEAPNLGVLTIGNDGLSIQYKQFCDYQTGVES